MTLKLAELKRASRFLCQNLDVILILAVFSIVATLLSYIRFEGFYGTNWDLGINMQMLWSTLHGKILYESGDYSIVGVKSFLLVHSTYLAVLVSLLYAILPFPTTLFVIQSIGIACSGAFVFVFAFQTTHERQVSLLTLFVYLSSFIVVSSLLYDYHWEALIPAETLALFYLWDRRRYWLSFIPFVLGCCTLEVFPFLASGLALYFLSRDIDWKFSKVLIKSLFDRRVIMSIVLIICSVLAYGVIRVMQYYALPRIFGQPNVYPADYTVGSFTFLFGVFHPDLNVAVLTYWLLIYASFAFIPFLHPRHFLMQLPWFLASITILPISNAGIGGFGVQYPLIALSAIGVGLSKGIGVIRFGPKGQSIKATPTSSGETQVELHQLPSFSIVAGYLLLIYYTVIDILLATSINPINILGNRGVLKNSYPYLFVTPLILLLAYWMSLLLLRRFSSHFSYNGSDAAIERNSGFHYKYKRKITKSLLPVLVIVLFVFNISMSPLNPGNSVNSTSSFGGYSFTLEFGNLSSYVYRILEPIPPSSTIVASDNLFPFVANDLNAYSLPYSPALQLHLPFNTSNLPDYLLVDTSMMYGPRYIIDNMFNSTIYGIKSFIYSKSYPGSIYLFQEGYRGSTINYRLNLFPKSFDIKPTDLATPSVGPGHLVASDSGRFGYVITSGYGTIKPNVSNSIWFGPYMAFPAGNYSVTFSLEGALSRNFVSPQTPLLYIDSSSVTGSSPILISQTILASQLSQNRWTNINFNISLSKPFPFVEFRGYLYFSGNQFNGNVSLNYIEVESI